MKKYVGKKQRSGYIIKPSNTVKQKAPVPIEFWAKRIESIKQQGVNK